ncbi:hypothetical protein [Streptomyces sp. NBC_01285]|uniref:hypothetical protein n=1 Tax=Streptomyces sp. NBC_01285 TaxID=2903813 RepID=UPI00225C3DED|nr:hypothetical protein [Streptomyces sp. NBC_01285]MCX4768214.1 hypothetical protein [Streptomyces sp. NBC_01285]
MYPAWPQHPSQVRRSEKQDLGLFVAAIDPTAFDTSYAQRAEDHLSRLASEHDADFGRRKTPITEVEIPDDVYRALTTP